MAGMGWGPKDKSEPLHAPRVAVTVPKTDSQLGRVQNRDPSCAAEPRCRLLPERVG